MVKLSVPDAVPPQTASADGGAGALDNIIIADGVQAYGDEGPLPLALCHALLTAAAARRSRLARRFAVIAAKHTSQISPMAWSGTSSIDARMNAL